MGRTASPVTPGTSPAAGTSTTTTDDAGTGTDTGDNLLDTSTGAAEGTSATAAPAGLDPAVAELIAAQAKQLAELTAMVKQMGRNQASATAAPVKLPTMADVLKQKPNVAVLTEEGWFVPAVHPTDRLNKA